MTISDIPTNLPGAELVAGGMEDLRCGRVTAAGCLVSIGERRFERSGLHLPPGSRIIDSPEHTLYQLLRHEGGDAYSRYNALLRQLASFEHALEHLTVRRAGV